MPTFLSIGSIAQPDYYACAVLEGSLVCWGEATRVRWKKLKWPLVKHDTKLMELPHGKVLSKQVGPELHEINVTGLAQPHGTNERRPRHD